MATWQVVASGPVRDLDERLGRTLADPAARPSAAQFFADLGAPTVAGPVLLVGVCWAGRRAWRSGAEHWWCAPLAAVLAMVAVPAVVAPSQALVARPGPTGPLTGGDGYFPSGHTATAAVAYGAVLVLWLPAVQRRWARCAVAGCYVALNVAVGIGLVWCGYHWPLDVLASWCLATLLLTAVVTVRGRRPAPP